MVHVSHLAILIFCMLAWLLQFVLRLIWLSQNVSGDSVWPWMLRLSFMLDLLVGGALVLLLVRALYWHPRSKAQVAAAVRKERQRIARELHDQVGSQLVNAMMLFDSKEDKTHPVVQTLEQCMLDLRLLVDVMGDQKGNLAEKLGTLRHRLQPVLDKRGIQLYWVVNAEPADQLPTGMRARELCRLVQEAISNVLQHSKASQLMVELRPFVEGSDGDWLLRVVDNGVGLQQSARDGYVGRGLAHMKRRAAKAGGTLSIVSEGTSGTQIIVVVSSKDFVPTVSTA
ncbi:ATP-binding protein [Diaphorobacter sp. HDW4B]|uniref:sensor histidine kinase n=1 Tax=Diaphorobacter sp. HDW4B TaxID=2714925 RepID=UPI00140D08C1|nr:ATP-binding protein [Diaphorobacter sp. HDW4B]QIL72972.1 ATP-binding protein [Diaphorobacter sp. HDW4B]